MFVLLTASSLRVPEAATIVITGAAPNFETMEVEEKRTFEAGIVKAKIALEDIFFEIARSRKLPSVIICDRGTMDSMAYMDPEEWNILLEDQVRLFACLLASDKLSGLEQRGDP